MHRICLIAASLVALVAAGALRTEARAAGAADASHADKDGFISLFDGKSLDGWRVNENAKSWRVADGELVVNGERSHLFYDGPVENHKFKNFELKLEIMTKPNSNSGVYVHTQFQPDGWPARGLEIQVNNTYEVDPRKTASVYGIKDVMHKSPAKDNEWFTMHITVKDKHVTVAIDGKQVNEYQQEEKPQREAGKEGAVVDSGTIALQGHDPGSEVHYRNIRVKPLP